jgi:methyl-accepting chemotaxis protein
MSNHSTKNDKQASLIKYILQTLLVVVPMSTIAGILMSTYIIKLSGSQFIISIVCFLAAGILLGVFASFRNYNKFIKPLNEISNLAMNLKDSNITYLIDEGKAGAQAEIIKSLNGSISNLRKTIKDTIDVGVQVSASPVKMKNSIQTLRTISEQVAAAIAELAKGASEQAGSMEEVSKSISSMVNGLSNITAEMYKTGEMAGNALNTVDTGEKSVHFQEIKMNESKIFVSKVSEAISALAEKSKEIGDILVVINGIAEQTNMLSLNAAIEAARAGEQGKGFAVVANEVRKLAEQSEHSVKQIEDLINEVQTDIENAVKEMNKVEGDVGDQEEAMSETVKAFAGISEAVSAITENLKMVNEKSSGITKSAKEAEVTIGRVTNSIEESASATEEIVASAEEQTGAVHGILEAAETLSELAETLKGNFTNFTV